MNQPVPLYQPRADGGAYQLRYAWTGWPADESFANPPLGAIESAKPHWERDGLRVLESHWTASLVQIVFSAKPDVSPEFVAARAKGRLDHGLRTAGLNLPFSRKVAIRSIGDNSRRDVEGYLARQVAKERFADPQFAERMTELTVVDSHIDLSFPEASAHGRYWYNLHLVLTTTEHAPVKDFEVLRALRAAFFKIALKKGHAVERLSVMPDHVHAALRPRRCETPLDVVFAYQNNLSYLVGQRRFWSDGYYVRTFGEYAMHAVRDRAEGDG